MSEKKSLLKKVKSIKHSADRDDFEKWLQTEERLAELIDRFGSLNRDLPSFTTLSSLENDERLIELLDELNDAHSALALEFIDLKLILYSLLRAIRLPEAELLSVVNPCTTAVTKKLKL